MKNSHCYLNHNKRNSLGYLKDYSSVVVSSTDGGQRFNSEPCHTKDSNECVPKANTQRHTHTYTNIQALFVKHHTPGRVI